MRRFMFSFLFSITAYLLTACGQNSADILLVEQGRSLYVIVTPAEPTKAESKAASILRDYIQRISGAKLTLLTEDQYKKEIPAIFVGNTEHKSGPANIKAEGYYVATHNNALYVRGGSGQGVVYGIYHLLQTYLGCRKDDQGPATVPASKNIRLKDNIADLQEPAFVYRETYYPASFDAEYLSWHKLHRFEDLWGLWGHSFFKLVPPKDYFKGHPEYYSLVNGKRQAQQLCLSNENVYNLVTAWFKKAIAGNPDAMYWSVAPEDGNGACTCDLCRQVDKEEGGPQGSLIRFVNRVAKQFPEQRFTTLAYGYTAKAPLKTRPAANVYIMLSTIDAFRHQPLEQEPSAAGFRKNLIDWEKVTENIFIWDYTTQFTNYISPFPDYNNLQPNLQYFSAHRVKGVFSQGSGETLGDMAAWNSYAQSCLLWKPDADIAQEKENFLKGYYGAAATYVGQYIEALTNAVKSTHSSLDIYGNPFFSAGQYLSPALIEQYSALLDKAAASVNDKDMLQQRVNTLRLSLEYVILQQSRFYGTEKYGYLQPDGMVQPGWKQRVKQFVAQCKKNGVTELSEGGLSPDAYEAEWQEWLARKWSPGIALGASVALVNPFTPEYTPKKERTLTDGLTGGKDFSYNWLFTYGKDMIATIDLGSTKTTTQIEMNFLQDARHYIFNPLSILIETSADGQHFTKVAQKEIPLPDEDYSVQINHYTFATGSSAARYIRVTAQCPPTLPIWRLVGGKKPALCCDEIRIQ
ncbi:DUF4838 domain-containing protein [Chitinophaga pendula]|uniref:DUF4838 domain-containing protein n=1 Tax=Chitinophaga TaxID=79328 RepID=UPI000BAFCADD|nr:MULTISPECIES: DUF4838 domain-containing protein [Chitinophaga]ASZ12543.1 hypothetical protein CK934_17050 [Chitinophaga sp. MD30]UCJ09853.1 DUF4838 domain-containing protein [Chitinophaga pendula]